MNVEELISALKKFDPKQKIIFISEEAEEDLLVFEYAIVTADNSVDTNCVSIYVS